MKNLTLAICLLVLSAIPLAASAQSYSHAWGQPLPADCAWTYVGATPTYPKVSCILPWTGNMLRFWNWFNTAPAPTK